MEYSSLSISGYPSDSPDLKDNLWSIDGCVKSIVKNEVTGGYLLTYGNMMTGAGSGGAPVFLTERDDLKKMVSSSHKNVSKL